MDFAQAKAFLSKQTDNGSSLYNHLSGIIKKVLEDKPQNVLDAFENISLSVKDSKLPKETNEIQQILTNENERNEISANMDELLYLLGKKKEVPKTHDKKNDDENEDESKDDDETKEDEPIDIKKIPNIFEDKDLYNWCGINIHENEMYLLQNGFKKLIKKYPSINSSRFWGKIQCIWNDYYIIECKLSEYPESKYSDEEKLKNKTEDPGRGCNEYVYYVTNNIEKCEWIQLPNIIPDVLKKSKNIYRLLTGNLDSKVNGINYFNGNESILLRCIIQRISCSTIIAPNNYYKKPDEINEEEPFNIEINEEFNTEEFENILAWVHIRGHLRLEARINKFIKPENDVDADNNEDKGDENESSPEETEEVIDILRGINDDKCDMYKVDGDDEENNKSNVWYVRDINKYIGHNIIVLNNKIWNGAKAIYVSGAKKFVNVYVGNGLKYRNEYYKPIFPKALEVEFHEYKVEEVPNPENEEEMINKKISIFNVEKELLPPAPEPQAKDDNPDDQGTQD